MQEIVTSEIRYARNSTTMQEIVTAENTLCKK